MEYKNIIRQYLLDNNLSNQPSRFRTKNWVEINDESKESYSANSDIRLKTTMVRSNLCDYADVYILVKGTITITGSSADATARKADERDKIVIFKNCPPFTKCVNRINGTDIDNAQDIDIAILMYNLIEYCDSSSKTSGSLWQYYKDDPNNDLTKSESIKSKVKIAGKTPDDGNTKHVEIMILLKYLSNFWRTLKTTWINFEVNLILTWSKDCVIINSNGERKFKITDVKLYNPVATSSTHDNAKLLQQLKSGFKRTINWNRCQSEPKTYAQSRYLSHLID